MAQLKDLIVNGASRFIGDIFGNKAQLTTLDAPETAGGSTYGPGTSGQVLKTNGTSIYWGADNNSGGTVTSVRVQATSPVVSSVNTAQTGTLNTTISLADGYGDTKNPYASKTKNYVLAAPSNANGAPSFRALVAADIPDLDTYLKKSGGTMTGALTLSGAPTSDLHAATKKYVDDAFAANDAMIFKGTISGGSTTETNNYGALTGAANRGWTYKVNTAGKINGADVEIGDILICLDDNTAAATSSNYATAQTHWVIVQNNVDGAVFKSSNSFTDGKVIIADGTNGKVKASSYSLDATVDSGTANRMAYYDTGHSITSAGHYVDDDKVSIGSTNAPATDEVFYVSGNSRLKGILIQGSSSITNANVTGDHAAAFNEATAVTGQNAAAFGYHTTASGSESIAFNSNTTASGDCSAAFGYKTSARGEYSFAEGEGSGDITVTFSGAANATSYTSTAEISSNALNYFIGYTNADVINLARITSINGTTFTTDKTLSSTALTNASGIVYRGVAYGKRSHVEGAESIAFGKESHAEGDGSAAIGDGSHAEGGHTQATGKDSHAEGYYASASGQYSHAEGRSTVASGEQAHAAGRETIASAANAHAEGIGTIARGNNQHVFGRYNVQDSGSGSSGVYAEIVGKGTADNDRSNARTLDWSGNETLAGNLLPMGTEQNLGSSSQRWQNIYLKSGTVNYMMPRDTSASVSVITIKNTSDEAIASFGFHNTGNGGNGAMYLIPYYAGLGDDSAYGGKHGLYIGTTTFKWENKYILRYSETATDGQVIISDGTTGNAKTSGYTIGASIGTGTAQYGIAYYSTTTNITSTAQGTNGALLTGKGANAPAWKASANGAVYATSANGDLQWGTLPIAQGGTGNTSYTANRLIYSESTSKLSASGHYASSTKIAVNSTSEPSYNLYVNGSQKIDSGSLQIYPTGGSYNDGIRIHARSSDNNWAGLMLCGTDNTEDTGTSANSWFIANNTGTLYVSLNGSSSATVRLTGHNATGFSARPRFAVNADVDTSYNLYVNGTSRFTDAVRIQYGGKPATLYLYDNSNDTSTHSIIRLGAATNENGAYIWLNGPSRTTDGGANTLSIRNNVGNLRLNNFTIIEVNNNWLTPSRLQVGRYDTTAATSDRAIIGVTDGNLHIDSYDAKEIYLQYYASNKYVRSGHIRPLTNNAYNLGDSSLKWANIYMTTAHGALDGNASTATKLATARAINGTNFDGSAAITTTKWGTARTITIGSNGKSVDGSANVAWTLAEIGATVSNAWVAGTTAGPTLTTTVNGVTGTAVAIPAAAAGASGVVTTGAQQFDGNKTFKGHIYPQANATYDIGSTSLRWRTGYLSTSLLIGGTSYTAGNSAAAGSLFGAGYIEMSGSTPFIDFHAGNNTGDYPARIISDTAGRITITGNVTPASLSYNSRNLVARFQCSGNQYTNGSVESNNAFVVNRAAKDGGFIAYTNNQQVARIYCATVGTASDGTTQGAQGVTWLMLGNNIARAAATATTGANNSKGSIRLYNEQTGYSDISGSYVSLGGTARNAVAMGYVNATQVYGAVWNDYAEFRQTKEGIEPGHCVKEIGDDTLELTTKRLERGCEIVSDTYGFAIGETEECQTPIASSGRVLAYPYESREEFASHIGWPVCSGPNGTVSIMTEEEEEKYPSRIIGTISAVPDYEEWGTGNVKVNGRVWIRIR